MHEISIFPVRNDQCTAALDDFSQSFLLQFSVRKEVVGVERKRDPVATSGHCVLSSLNLVSSKSSGFR